MLTISPAAALEDLVLTPGGGVHYYFGSKQFRGYLECGVWPIKQLGPIGFDGGIEVGGKELRTYAEWQLFGLFAGISHGAYYAWITPKPKRFGWQGKVWMGPFGPLYLARDYGADDWAVGGFLKVPYTWRDGGFEYVKVTDLSLWD